MLKSGRHTGAFVSYRPDAVTADGVMPPTGKGIRRHPDPLVPHPGRPDRQALGEPRRPGHGPAGRVGPPVAGLPAPRGHRQAPLPPAPRLKPARIVAPGSGTSPQAEREHGQCAQHYQPGHQASQPAEHRRDHHQDRQQDDGQDR